MIGTPSEKTHALQYVLHDRTHYSGLTMTYFPQTKMLRSKGLITRCNLYIEFNTIVFDFTSVLIRNVSLVSNVEGFDSIQLCDKYDWGQLNLESFPWNVPTLI